jgi:hypothetical protein
MNTTLNNPAAGNFKRLGTFYLGAACVLALAVVAIIAGPWPTGRGPVSSPAQAELVATDRQVVVPASAYYYVVDSRAQADLLQAAINGEKLIVEPATQPAEVQFFVAQSFEDERRLVELGRELMAVGTDFRIIDLRGR